MRLAALLAVVAIGCGGDPFTAPDSPEAAVETSVTPAVAARPEAGAPEVAADPPDASAAPMPTLDAALDAPPEADATSEPEAAGDATDASAAPRCGTVTTCANELDCFAACGSAPSGERWYCFSDTNQPPSCDLRLSDAGLWPLDGAYQTP